MHQQNMLTNSLALILAVAVFVHGCKAPKTALAGRGDGNVVERNGDETSAAGVVAGGVQFEVGGKPILTLVLETGGKHPIVHLRSIDKGRKVAVRSASFAFDRKPALDISVADDAISFAGTPDRADYGKLLVVFRDLSACTAYGDVCRVEDFDPRFDAEVDLAVQIIDAESQASGIALTSSPSTSLIIGLGIGALLGSFLGAGNQYQPFSYFGANPSYYNGYFNNPMGPNSAYTGGQMLGYGYGSYGNVPNYGYGMPGQNAQGNGYGMPGQYQGAQGNNYGYGYGYGYGGLGWGSNYANGGGFNLQSTDPAVAPGEECDHPRYGADAPYAEIRSLYQKLPKRVRKVFPSVTGIVPVDDPADRCGAADGVETKACWTFDKISDEAMNPVVYISKDTQVIHASLLHMVISAAVEHYLLGIGSEVTAKNPRLGEISSASAQLVKQLATEIEEREPELYGRLRELFSKGRYDDKRQMSFMLSAFGQKYFCSSSSRKALATLAPDSVKQFEKQLLPLLAD